MSTDPPTLLLQTVIGPAPPAAQIPPPTVELVIDTDPPDATVTCPPTWALSMRTRWPDDTFTEPGYRPVMVVVPRTVVDVEELLDELDEDEELDDVEPGV
jgi:hypothetical protein